MRGSSGTGPLMLYSSDAAATGATAGVDEGGG